MVFLESFGRPLLVIHAVAACVLVAATTHHVVWCRGYLRGEFKRVRGEKRFAIICSAAYVTAFLLGSLLYPSYKVRVRAEYFDNPAAVAEEARLRGLQRKAVAEAAAEAPVPNTARLSQVARVFDIKEHWVALGCAASVALLLLSRRAHPKDDARVVHLYVALSLVQCGTAWTGALVGLLTASYRAVGGAT